MYVVRFTDPGRGASWAASLELTRDDAACSVVMMPRASDPKLASTAAKLLPRGGVSEEEALTQLVLFFGGVVFSGASPRILLRLERGRGGEVVVADAPNPDSIEAYLRCEWGMQPLTAAFPGRR